MADSVSAMRGFAGLRVVCFESRRAMEIAELVRRNNGVALTAPTMREVPLAENPAALELADRLERGEIDFAIFLTGVGTRFLADLLADRLPGERFAAVLTPIVTVVRGPKPRAALRELGVQPTIVVPEPNTWREVLSALDRYGPLVGRRVAVQEYGEENPELVRGLVDRGARVSRVPIYRWALPEDLAPLRGAISELLAGSVDVALFTSGTQVEHLFRVAGDGVALVTALSRVVIASIGPVCTEALARRSIRVDIEPVHPKMGHLVLAAAERSPALLARKRP